MIGTLGTAALTNSGSMTGGDSGPAYSGATGGNVGNITIQSGRGHAAGGAVPAWLWPVGLVAVGLVVALRK